MKFGPPVEIASIKDFGERREKLADYDDKRYEDIVLSRIDLVKARKVSKCAKKNMQRP